MSITQIPRQDSAHFIAGLSTPHENIKPTTELVVRPASSSQASKASSKGSPKANRKAFSKWFKRWRSGFKAGGKDGQNHKPDLAAPAVLTDPERRRESGQPDKAASRSVVATKPKLTRKETDFAKPTYILERNVQEVLRMNYQHYLLKDAMGFLLHPDILEDVGTKRDLKVLDIGSGTVQWPIDLTRAFPNINLHIDAVDISNHMFPPQEWLPSNIKLGMLDILTNELPQEYIGQYDIVNCKLLTSVVRGNDPSKLANNMARCLKPGGWLQWTEMTPETFGVVTVSPDSTPAKVNELNGMLLKRTAAIGLFYDWIPALPGTLWSAPNNLISVSQRVHCLEPEDLFLHGANIFTVYRQLLTMGCESEAESKAVLALIAEAWDECRESKGMVRWEPVTTVGRKSVEEGVNL